MKEWQVRQRIYHRLNREHRDAYGPDDIEMMEHTDAASVIETVCRYMSGWVPEKVVYPAKSYFVAIVYARLLWDHFKQDPVEALMHDDLLFGNDPHFKSYHNAEHIYNAVIEVFGWDFDLTLGEIPDVEDYFRAEFMLDQEI